MCRRSGKRTYWRHLRRPLDCVLLLLFLTGTGSWAWMVLASRAWRAQTHVQMPLGDLEGIAVDNQARIYLGANAYSRIQVYNRFGDFQRSIFIGSATLTFEVDSEDLLHVRLGRRYRTYSPSGKLLKESPDPPANWHPVTSWTKDTDKHGNVYKILRFSYFFPRIIKISPSGKREIVVSQPWYMWMVQAPFPAGMFFGMGLFYYTFLQVRQDRRKKRQKAFAQRN